MIKILKYFGEIILILSSVFALLVWAFLGLPANHTYFVLIFFIVFLLVDIFLEWKEPEKYQPQESSELRNLVLNESLTYSSMLLSTGFAAVVAGISLASTFSLLSLALIIIGGFSVVLGQFIAKFIYRPRANYIRTTALKNKKL